MSALDPAVQQLLLKVKEANRPPFWQDTPQAARTLPLLMDLLFGSGPDVAYEDFTIGSLDDSSLAVRLYRPEHPPRGWIVYLHGGGWVVGSVAAYHPLTATIARRTGCAVLSVDYRLAPEHPFPLPLDDARAAIAWAAVQSAGPLVVMGDSAGANLATVAARDHHLRGLRPIDLQVLAYPVCDHDFDTGSYRAYADGFLLSRSDMMWFWDQYCPDSSLRRHPNLSPCRIPDLSGSPAALILTAACDPLRDEGEVYGERLRNAGVAVETLRCEGLVHGFLAMINYAPSAARAFDHVVSRIDQATFSMPIRS